MSFGYGRWIQVTRRGLALLLFGSGIGCGFAQVQIDPAVGANLAWNDNSQNEVSFRIERRTASGAYALLTNAPGLTGFGGVATYRDMALESGTTYVYRVRAENSSGVSGWTNEVTISTTGSPPPPPNTIPITSQPTSLTSVAGSAAYFSVSVSATSPTYQWYRDGVALQGQTTSVLYLSSVQSSDAGTYTVTIVSPDGTATSDPVTLTVVTSGNARVQDVTARAVVSKGGDNQVVAGAVFAGSGQKKLLIRAIGPQLASFGITGFLPDPMLTVYQGSTKVVSNDNWGTFSDQAGLETARVAAGAFPLNVGSKDAALVANLNAGSAYTTQTTSRTGSGLALFQLYDVDPAASTSKVANVTARGNVGTADKTLVGEFTLNGNVGTTLLIRGVGPGLKQFGVHGTLSAPVLSLFRGAGLSTTPVAVNTRWEQNANLSALKDATTRTGAYALTAGGLDTALLIVLPPGHYTVQINGQNQTTGIAAVELFVVP